MEAKKRSSYGPTIRLPYLVQQSDGSERWGRDGFDFGGVNGGLARFVAKGDAILYAQELRRREPQFAVRVVNLERKGEEVFRSGG